MWDNPARLPQPRFSRRQRSDMLRKDDLQNGYHIFQDPDYFCFGVDAVLLAHFPKLKKGDRILDMGTGFAPIPLILHAEAKKRGLDLPLTGLEIQEYPAQIAEESVVLNHLEDAIDIVRGDIKEAAKIFGAASFSLITCNPPYMAAADGLVGESEQRAIARTEVKCTLADVIREAAKCLVPGGRFAMIHRPFRLVEIFEEMRKNRLEPKRLRLICPYPDAEPTMVLVEGVRGGKPYLVTEPPLIIYQKDGSYTKELLHIYGRD